MTETVEAPKTAAEEVIANWEDLSPWEQFCTQAPEVRKAKFDSLTPEQQTALKYMWRGWLARPKQLAPDGDWSTWVIRAGRFFGKTRAGSSWVHERAMAQAGRWIAFVARTPADARDYMIEGPGGILRNTPPRERPLYEVSKRRLTWPNDSWATIYSDEEPDQCRGFSGDTAWLDEFGKYKNPVETWDNLAFGLREVSKDMPRRLITTTPRPLQILKDIEKQSSTVVTIGTSYENKANVAPTVFEDIKRYVGTRQGRQEINAEIIDDLPGALWTRAIVEGCKITKDKLPEMRRVVVGVDPSGAGAEDNAKDRRSEDQPNKIGIVVCGLGVDNLGYVLADYTLSGSPEVWGRAAVKAYHFHKADKIVAEKNFGGGMVEFVMRTVDKGVPIKLVTASRGKFIRAEPVAALYEQGRIKHLGSYPELEDQMCAMMPEPQGFTGVGSPDNMDAMVWGITELMLQMFEPLDSLTITLPRVMTSNSRSDD